MPNGTYGGVRGKETKIGRKTFVSLPTRLNDSELSVCCTGDSTIIKNIPFSNRVYGLTFSSFPTRNI